jgi:hypothetical protein
MEALRVPSSGPHRFGSEGARAAGGAPRRSGAIYRAEKPGDALTIGEGCGNTIRL